MATGTREQPHLDCCRDLHEAYFVTMRALLKKSNPDLKRRLAAICYKQDLLTCENCFLKNDKMRKHCERRHQKKSESNKKIQ